MQDFDVRNARPPAAVLQPFKQSCAGVVFKPAGRTGMLVAALQAVQCGRGVQASGAHWHACGSPSSSPVAGVVFKPAGRTGMLVAASEKGSLTVIDMRMATMSATSSSSKPTDPSPSCSNVYNSSLS
eukprot:gene20687-27483_t